MFGRSYHRIKVKRFHLASSLLLLGILQAKHSSLIKSLKLILVLMKPFVFHLETL